MQLDACIPNFSLQEYTGEDRPPKSEILVEPLVRDGGYLIVWEDDSSGRTEIKGRRFNADGTPGQPNDQWMVNLASRSAHSRGSWA